MTTAERKFDALMSRKVAGFGMDAVLLSAYIEDVPEAWRKIDDHATARGLWTGKRLERLLEAQRVLRALGKCAECAKPIGRDAAVYATCSDECFGRHMRRRVMRGLSTSR